MKFAKLCISFLMVLLFMTACVSSGPSLNDSEENAEMSWQDYYDLGIRYLSEGNYEEAIIAFTAAIEIDSKQPKTYLGRGDAHVGFAELSVIGTEELNDDARIHYEQAVDDYLTVIDLDGSIAEAYQKAADAYIALGDLESAISILQRGIETIGDESLQMRLNEISLNTLSEESTSEDDYYYSEEYGYYFVKNYRDCFDFDFSENPPAVGGKNLVDWSFDELVAYYGAKIGDGYEDIMVADVYNSGPISLRSGRGVHIQYNLKYNTISVTYSLYGREPEFWGIQFGDSMEGVLKKIGLTERGEQLLENAGYIKYRNNIHLGFLPDGGCFIQIFEVNNADNTLLSIDYFGESQISINFSESEDAMFGCSIQAQKNETGIERVKKYFDGVIM